MRSPRAASVQSTTKIGSQQNTKLNRTVTKVFVTLASSTFTQSWLGLLSEEKMRFDLETVRNTVTWQIVMTVRGVAT